MLYIIKVDNHEKYVRSLISELVHEHMYMKYRGRTQYKLTYGVTKADQMDIQAL